MKSIRLIAVIVMTFLSAICVGSVAAQVPTNSMAANSAPKSTATDGKVGLVRVMNGAAFYDGIQEIKIKRDKLNTEFAGRRQQLMDLDQRYNAKQNELKGLASNVSVKAREDLMAQVADMERQLKRGQEDFQADGNRRLSEETAPVYQKIGKFLQAYTAQHNIAIVLDLAVIRQAEQQSQQYFLLYLDPSMDITKDFMDEYNKANPVAGATPPAPASTTTPKPKP